VVAAVNRAPFVAIPTADVLADLESACRHGPADGSLCGRIAKLPARRFAIRLRLKHLQFPAAGLSVMCEKAGTLLGKTDRIAMREPT
jgi:hypothetical protein